MRGPLASLELFYTRISKGINVDFPGRTWPLPPLGPPMWCLSLAGPTLGQLKISVAVSFIEASLCKSICRSTLTLLIFNLLEATNNTGIC